jgi:hypothetical protein
VATLSRALHAQSSGDGPQGAREAIVGIVRTIFAQPDHASAVTQLRKSSLAFFRIPPPSFDWLGRF